MAFFGSVYQTSSTLVQRDLCTGMERRQIAISAIQKELNHHSCQSIAAFLACLVLAATEALIGDLANALIHARGAFKVAEYHFSPDSSTVSSPIASSSSFSDYSSTISKLALSMDLHTAWFRLSQAPDLGPNFGPHDLWTLQSSLRSDDNTALALLHSCYHFTSRAAPFKYQARSKIPESLIEEQCRYLTALRTLLRVIHQKCSKSDLDKASVKENRILRAQSVSTLIYVSSILDPHETSYDSHESDFCLLIDDCEQLLPNSTHHQRYSAFRYRFEPGILQPCYITAMKSRNLLIRQRAVAILGRLGSEGPWNGPFSAAVASRAIELEHGSSSLPVPESRRIHGCGTFTMHDDNSFYTKSTRVEYSFCNDVEQMLLDGDHEDSRHWTTVCENFDPFELPSG